MLVGIKKHIDRMQAQRDWIADAAQIDDISPANLTIERNMGMPDDDQVRLAASQPLLQVVIAVPGLETGSVVSAWSSMDAEYACAIRYGQTHFQRHVREPVQPACSAEIAPGPGEAS